MEMEIPEMGDPVLFHGQIQPQEGKREEDSQKAPRPPPSHQKCPRCWSTNTKFCYYNNYSCSQPRYFCKDCKRYWTLGGSLRDVPLGGYTRRDKRSKKAMGTPDDNNIQETRPPCQGVYQSSVISSLNPTSSFPEASGLGLPPL